MVKLTKIYTRTGDRGETGLVDGSRLPKDAPRMAAIGAVDEANAAIGVASVELADPVFRAMLDRIQNEMFDLGADLATPGEDFTPSPMALRILPEQASRLEREMDAMNEELGPLTSFILPGGSRAGAALHVARTLVRRAERDAVTAARAVAINPAALAYVNRLSDHLFTLARAVNARGSGDILWRPGATRGA